MKRILIADDHEVVRSGLRAIVETHPNWIVSAEATNGEQAVALTLETRPDILIVDYSMPIMNGLEVSRRLKALHLRAEVLILTMHESEELLTEAILAGVRGFLFKSDARKHLISAIEALIDGRPYFTSILLEKLLHDYQANKQNRGDMLLTASGVKFVESSIEAPADTPFTIVFDNTDSGTAHDVDLHDASGAVVFNGEPILGVKATVYDVDALPAGSYTFVCSLHPSLMSGTATIK